MDDAKVRWEWIGEGWQLFSREMTTWVLMTLGYLAIMFILVAPIYAVMVGSVIANMPEPGTNAAPPELPATFILLLPFFYVTIILLSTWLMSGMYNAAFKQLRGETIGFGDLFSGMRFLPRMLGATILIGLIAGIGVVFCIVPGLVAAGLLSFTVPLIIANDMGVIEAMQKSVEVTKREWLMFTVFIIVLYFLASAGAYVCGIGMLFTWPLLFTTHAVAHRDCAGMPGARPAGFYEATQNDGYGQTPGYYPPPPASAPPPPSGAISCPRCQAPNEFSARFCIRCGTPFQ
ncbi:MAG: YciC family protein [Blastocatellia bacterium]